MLTFNIVGAYYRPPAQLIINGLSQGTKLYLRAEPTNQFDPNAIQVFLKTEDIPPDCHDAIEEEVAKRGIELNQILAESEWHLGYIKKEIALEMKKIGFIDNEKEIEGKFKIDFGGKPNIEIEEKK